MSNLGDQAEAVFTSQCIARGWGVSVPVSGSSPYDRIVDTGEALYKVQVKATGVQRPGRCDYKINLCNGSGRAYRASDVDIYACWIRPTDDWYLIPFSDAPASLVVTSSTAPAKRRHQRNDWKIFENTACQSPTAC